MSNYNGKNAKELTFSAGDVIMVQSRKTGKAGWWMGKLGSDTGLFRTNVTQLLPPGGAQRKNKDKEISNMESKKRSSSRLSLLKEEPPSADTNPTARGQVAVVIGAFHAESDSELSVRKGDEVTVIRRASELGPDWWTVQFGGKVGAVPTEVLDLQEVQEERTCLRREVTSPASDKAATRPRSAVNCLSEPRRLYTHSVWGNMTYRRKSAGDARFPPEERAPPECMICLEEMTSRQPRALSCLHTFCEECLCGCILIDNKDKETVKCPTCRGVTVLPPGGVSALPYNFLIGQMTRNTPLINGDTACQVCIENMKEMRKAETFCKECDRRLCGDCHKKHSSVAAFKTHNIRAWTPRKKPLSSHQCSRHGNPVNLFCQQCMIGICVDCAMSQDHMPHHNSVKNVTEGAQMLKQGVTELKDKLIKMRTLMDEVDASESCRVLSADFNILQSDIKKCAETAKDAIDMEAQCMLDFLEIKRNETMAAIKLKCQSLSFEAGMAVGELSSLVSEDDHLSMIVKGPKVLMKGKGTLDTIKDQTTPGAMYPRFTFIPSDKPINIGRLLQGADKCHDITDKTGTTFSVYETDSTTWV